MRVDVPLRVVAAWRVMAWTIAMTAALVCMPSYTWAAGTFALCGPGFEIPSKPDFEGDPTKEIIEITADDAELSDEGVSLLRGNVQYGSGSRRLLAEQLTYDKPNEHIVARGSLKLWDDGLFVDGESVELDLGKDQADFRNSTFVLQDAHGRGGAQRMVISGRDLVQVEDAYYTTCNAEQEDWLLSAKHIELDKIADVGTARDVTVEFYGTPIFYAPFMTFPLSDKRKSGFLTPSFGIGGETGLEATVPYYFDIAPQLDATVWARGMTRRGVLLGGEFRYLTRVGSGALSAEIVPRDLVDDDFRGLLRYKHRGSFAPDWQGNVDYSRVSDRDFFEDFGNKLSVTSTQHLQQMAEALYARDNWSFQARVQSFQTIDRTIAASDRPYKRLPQLLLNYQTPERNRELQYGFGAEAVYFDRSQSVDGVRLNVSPSVSYPMRNVSGFLVPTAKMHLTHYSLGNTAAGQDDSQTRFVPSFNLDGGLFFERDMSLFGSNYVQTLEPRVYYLYQGFDDQRDLPVFDTGEYTFNFSQLFRDDRFSGVDRLGDAHQVSLALTSRLLSGDGGRELMRASVGQIRFLRDRRVQLPGQIIQRDDSSAIVGEIAAQVTDAVSLSAGMQWNPHENETDRSTLSMRYQPDSERVVNAGYRFVRDAVETLDFSFRWPVRHDIGVVGRWNYALPDERTLDAFAGIEFNSCCWSTRAIVRRFLSDTNGDYTNAFFLQLELKGLAGLGRNAEEFLQRSIPGYQNPF